MNIIRWNKDESFPSGIIDPVYKDKDHCDIYIVEGKGYAVLNHKPKYSLYARLGIPEIQDVYVLPDYRGQGIASALINHCEKQAPFDMIGISVSVSPKYSVAQRLYAKLGY